MIISPGIAGKWAIITLIGVWFLAAGCAQLPDDLLYKETKCLSPDDPEFETTVHIQYLGCGGFLLRRGNASVLTAPFFSNPGPLRVGLLSIKSNTNRVDRLLPRLADSAETILVGHSHYDHLLDVPFIANHRTTNAKILGSSTMSNLVCGVIKPSRLRSLEFDAGDLWSGGRPGIWVTNDSRTIRFMPLRSEHAPQYKSVKLFCGEVVSAQKEPPKSAWQWKEGQTLSYLIDFLADTNIAFRIFYHDSCFNSPRFGAVPELLPEDQRPIDVGILAMASSKWVTNYPAYVVTANNLTNVIVGHWENFFRSPERKVKPVRYSNPVGFMNTLKECGVASTNAFLPKRNAIMLFKSF